MDARNRDQLRDIPDTLSDLLFHLGKMLILHCDDRVPGCLTGRNS